MTVESPQPAGASAQAEESGRDSLGMDDIRSRLRSPVIGDILDTLGRYHQFLPPGIRPLREGPPLVGRAMPVLINDEFSPPARAFGRLTEALDSLTAGEVYLARGGRVECAAWGEILSTTARARGAAGAVIDGFHRDTAEVVAQRWPVFSRGPYGQDAGARASVRDFGVPIEIGRVRIEPGDLVFGDVDGVVVVPRTIEAEVLERALVKAQTESDVLTAISAGMSSTEAYATFGVL